MGIQKYSSRCKGLVWQEIFSLILYVLRGIPLGIKFWHGLGIFPLVMGISNPDRVGLKALLTNRIEFRSRSKYVRNTL